MGYLTEERFRTTNTPSRNIIPARITNGMSKVAPVLPTVFANATVALVFADVLIAGALSLSTIENAATRANANIPIRRTEIASFPIPMIRR